MSRLIGGLIGIVVMVSLVPSISKQVKDVSMNFTGSHTASVVLSAVPVFFVLGILLFAIVTIYSALREAGLVEGAVESGEYEEEYEKSGRKQTYEEYVRERIKVERIMKRGWIGRWI